MTDHEMSNYLTPAKGAAEKLGVTAARIHQMVAEGKLTPAMKAPGLRGALFFTLTEIDRYKESKK